MSKTLLAPLNTTQFVFVDTRAFTSKKGNPMMFVTLADENTYERFQFMADKECNLNFETKQKVIPTISLSNYNNNPSLQLHALEAKK